MEGRGRKGRNKIEGIEELKSLRTRGGAVPDDQRVKFDCCVEMFGIRCLVSYKTLKALHSIQNQIG